MRDMSNTDGASAKASGWSTLKGDPDRMVCVAKATFDDGEVRVMKSTKAVQVCDGYGAAGCLIQTTTEHSVHGVAESMVWVPGVCLAQIRSAYGTVG